MNNTFARKSWTRRASIDLWLKAERHAEADIFDAVVEFLKDQRRDVATEVRKLYEKHPEWTQDKDAAERIVDHVYDAREWDEDLRNAVGPAIARTVIRGYLSTRAVQAGRRRRFPPVWRKGGPGSGNFGHEGRPGEVGGSAPNSETSQAEGIGTRDDVAKGDFSRGISSNVTFLHGSRDADKILNEGFDLGAAGMYSGSGEISGINLTLSESVARRFAGSSGKTLEITLTRDIKPEEILDVKTEEGRRLLESLPGGEKGRQALLARGIVAVVDYNVGGALGGEGEVKILDSDIVRFSERKVYGVIRKTNRSGRGDSSCGSHPLSISRSVAPDDGGQFGIQPEGLVDSGFTDVPTSSKDDRSGLSRISHSIKQGWADAPLTDDELREVLEFELPENVTRRVYKVVGEVMDKPYWKDVNDVERERMRWSLQEGIEEGKTLRQIAKDIQRDIASDEVRARRITVTETTNALSAGHIIEGEEAEDLGIKIAKIWMDIGDDKVRPTHEEANGQVVEGSQGMFTVGGYQCIRPGDPDLPAEERCGCRCYPQIESLFEAEKSSWVRRNGVWIDRDYAELARRERVERLFAVKGGPGSGNFGHEGRPGEVGGSATGNDDLRAK